MFISILNKDSSSAQSQRLYKQAHENNHINLSSIISDHLIQFFIESSNFFKKITHHAIVYVGVMRCPWVVVIVNYYRVPSGTLGILCFYYAVQHCHPPTNVLFVCDTNTSRVVTFAIENIWTKAHQCLFWNLQKLWCVV